VAEGAELAGAGRSAGRRPRAHPATSFGFGKAKFESTLFISNLWFILIKSSQKLKQTPPY
jgi:hypothetical protein